MKRSKPIEKPRPQIGDFVARNIWGCDWYIAKVTGDGWQDYERAGFACATQEGAEKLAALMNAARDLGERGHLLTQSSMYRNTDPALWAREIIASAVSKAIDGPQPEMFHEFLQRREAVRCEPCQPAPIGAASQEARP